ncbi:hypothetical protein [Thauera sp. SDU_THAU2]|uniref:hypothetical protein n=1 Tax=Thauera sp. SDU_THAU2 TaxID=3136633 RepID=UPI00311D4821
MKAPARKRIKPNTSRNIGNTLQHASPGTCACLFMGPRWTDLATSLHRSESLHIAAVRMEAAL